MWFRRPLTAPVLFLSLLSELGPFLLRDPRLAAWAVICRPFAAFTRHDPSRRVTQTFTALRAGADECVRPYTINLLRLLGLRGLLTVPPLLPRVRELERLAPAPKLFRR